MRRGDQSGAEGRAERIGPEERAEWSVAEAGRAEPIGNDVSGRWRKGGESSGVEWESGARRAESAER